MPRRSGARRVATVVLLDIVGSTRIAADVGDERWRAILDRFRRVVRGRLRAFGGHEEDTAGDGFFVSFDQPAAAIRFASSIVGAVQSIGIDVRCGVHTGEIGSVQDGRPGGIAVHVGARVMALAGPAEIVCTATVRDLVLGDDLAFESVGTHVLRDVPGDWTVLRLTSSPEPLPQPLEDDAAHERLAAVEAVPARRVPVLIAAVIAAGLAASLLGLALRSGHEQPHALGPPSLVRIDPSTNRVVQTLGVRPPGENTVLGAADGVLWQRTNGALVARRISDGGRPFPIEVGDDALLHVPTFGFGAAWTSEELGTYTPDGKLIVTRYDERSGRSRRTAVHVGFLGYHPFSATGSQTQFGVAFRAFVAGPTAIWFLAGGDTKLYRMDPVSMEVRSWSTGRWSNGDVGPTQILPTTNAVWLCAPFEDRVLRFDASTHRVDKILDAPHGSCPIAVTDGGASVWLLDRVLQTVSRVDVETGVADVPLGVASSAGEGNATGIESYAFGAVWIPAGRFVYRVDLASETSTPIAMPAGVLAASVAADERSGTVWVGDCDPQACTWIRPQSS